MEHQVGGDPNFCKWERRETEEKKLRRKSWMRKKSRFFCGESYTRKVVHFTVHDSEAMGIDLEEGLRTLPFILGKTHFRGSLKLVLRVL